MSSVEVKTGSEGPHYDPYHYTEIRVKRVSPSFTGTIISHDGFVEWVRVEWPDGKVERFTDTDRDVWFELYAGISTKTALRAHQEAQARRIRYHRCGERNLMWAEGYPGESFLVCGKCKDVLQYHFDIGAVI